MSDNPPRLGATTGPSMLRQVIASADDDDPRADQLEHLATRVAPLFIAPMSTAAVAPAVKAAALAKGALNLKVLGAIVAAAAVGAGGVGAYHHEAKRPQPTVALASPSTGAPTVVPLVPFMPSTSGEPTPTTAAPAEPNAGSVRDRAIIAGSDRHAEYALVARAGHALVAKDNARALELADEHLHRFASGEHGEERERIAIEALSGLGRREEALARARRFSKRYPRSVYQPRIDALTGGVGSRP